MIPASTDIIYILYIAVLYYNCISREVSEDLAGFIMKNYMSEESEQLESDLSVN